MRDMKELVFEGRWVAGAAYISLHSLGGTPSPFSPLPPPAWNTKIVRKYERGWGSNLVLPSRDRNKNRNSGFWYFLELNQSFDQ